MSDLKAVIIIWSFSLGVLAIGACIGFVVALHTADFTMSDAQAKAFCSGAPVEKSIKNIGYAN